MSTKLEIFFEIDGVTLAVAAHLVANHNSGKDLLSINDVRTILKSQNTIAPSTLKNFRVELIEDEGKVNVYEDGVNVNYVIQESNVIFLVADMVKGNPIYERNNK